MIGVTVAARALRDGARTGVGWTAPVFTQLKTPRGATGRGSNRRWTYMISAVLQPLWRGYTAVVGGIIIVAVSASDRRGSSVIAWRVISTGRSSTDGSSTDGSSPDAYRHSAAHGRTTVNTAAIDTTVVNADATNSNASAICKGVS